MKDQRTKDLAASMDGIIDDAEKHPASRRGALRTLGKLGLGAATVSLSTFLGARPRNALAEGMPPDPLEILNYALTLEYLEMFFYQAGTDSNVIPSDVTDVYDLIEKHESSHVTALTAIIKKLGGTPVEFARGDFTYAVAGLDPFNNYNHFLLLSEAFEDTGVRAYKGQAPNIPPNASVTVQGATINVLTAALQIHALEARHAAEVRRLRAISNDVDIDPWIVLKSKPVPGPLEPVYAAGPTFPAEDNVTQASIDLTTLGDGYSDQAASAAFDEPFTMQPVLKIADPFIAGDQTP